MKKQDYDDFAASLDEDTVVKSAIYSVAAYENETRAAGEFDDVLADTHRNAPRPDPACLYGLMGDVARAGSKNTEANPFAIAAAMLAYMC